MWRRPRRRSRAASHIEARRQLDRALELVSTVPESDEHDLTELTIRMLRTVSVSSLFGYGYPDVYEDFEVADKICRKLTERPEIMPAQLGIWSYFLVRGDVDEATVVLEPLIGVLDSPKTAWFAPEIRSCVGYAPSIRAGSTRPGVGSRRPGRGTAPGQPARRHRRPGRSRTIPSR
jgi:hypothetical protein